MVALELRLPIVEGSDSDLPLFRADCRTPSAVLFQLDMASSLWLGVTSIFATCEGGCGPNVRNAHYAYAYRVQTGRP